jgi:hypothetical protein
VASKILKESDNLALFAGSTGNFDITLPEIDESRDVFPGDLGDAIRLAASLEVLSGFLIYPS